MRIEANPGRNDSIFATSKSGRPKSRRSIGFHNIDKLYSRLTPEMAADIYRRYKFRGGALDHSAEETGLYVPEPTEDVFDHAEYQGATMGKKFRVYSTEDLKRLKGNQDTQVVPYINTPDTEAMIEGLGHEVWGLPPIMVSALKNKVNFHELVRGYGIEGLEVPEFRVANIGNIPEKAREILNEASELYSKYDVGNYPRGVVIRAEESDGNYGTSLIREKDGEIEVIPDADKKRVGIFRSGEWTKAFKYAQSELRTSTGKSSDTQFVVSRFMDITDSPGMSLIINNGQFESLGWNGQTMAEGTNACVGTTRYNPEGRYAKELQKTYEEQSAEAVAEFIRRTAKICGVPLNEINGVINMDLMIPGPYEANLRENRSMKKGFYLAECNPRWTNYTDAALQVVGILGEVPSARGIQRVVWDGVHTIDKRDLEGANTEIVRRLLYDLDERAKAKGDTNRVFLRMPGIVEADGRIRAGFILTGDRIIAEKRLGLAIRKAKGDKIYSRTWNKRNVYNKSTNER